MKSPLPQSKNTFLSRFSQNVLKLFTNSQNNLKTPIGKIIDRISYIQIGVIIIITILGCGAYFYFANPSGNGTNHILSNYGDAVYFSIITFSSLGYGDKAPVGVGKTVASLEVIFGLISIATLVGKVASERQATLLLLLYTSEQERRISGHERELEILHGTIDSALSDHNDKAIHKNGNNTYALLSGIISYLRFQSNVAGLADFGNDTALRGLYQSLNKIQTLCYEVVRTYKIPQQTQTTYEQIIRLVEGISVLMLPFHANDDRAQASLNSIQNFAGYASTWKAKEKKSIDDYKYRSEATPELLRNVLIALQAEPFSLDIHRNVAKKLNIPNKLAERCVNTLVINGQWSAPTK